MFDRVWGGPKGTADWFFRPLLLAAIVAIAFVFLGAPLQAAPKFSAIAVDARNGKVLYSVDPDGSRYPASLTKVMTLYLLFQDLKAGKVSLKTPLKVSSRAAGMPPSKLGLKPGSTITVDQAIRALVTKSANDVASVVGENLGGSEAQFATRMTKVARSLGMSKTTFKNASGLPNPGQVTSARDMATLSLRVQRDFPQYYPYFRTMSFTYKGRVIRTHNRLLGNYEGTDGIKTGYINASGFNLTSSVRRGDKRLVGVVLGAKSGTGRNAYMMGMLDKAFPKAKGGKTIAAVAGSSKGAVDPVAATEEPKKKQSIADLILKPKDKPSEPDGEVTELAAADSGALVPGTEQPTEVEQGSTFQAVESSASAAPHVLEAKIEDGATPAEVPFEVKPEVKQDEVTASLDGVQPSGWNVQVGAFRKKTDAQKTLLTLKKSQPTLKDKMAFTVTVQQGNSTSYKARFSGFNEEDAKALCSKLSKQKVDCLPVAPQS